MNHECIILADSPAALVEFCGISTMERLLRTLQRCGITRATVLSSTPEPIKEQLAQPSWARAELDLTVRSRPAGPVTIEQIVDLWPEGDQLLLVVPADVVCDSRLLQLLVSQNEPAALVDSAVPSRLQPLFASAPDTNRGKLCGPALIRREWASAQKGPLLKSVRAGLERQTLAVLDVAEQPLYYIPMRRELRPYWFPSPSPDCAKLAKRVLLDSTQKGTLDIPAFIHGPVETFLVSHLCKTSITPNQLTVFTNVVAWVTTILFATGRLGWGTALALVVGVLDGLDGKQARVKVETTKRGKLEHWFDAFFEISWWTALAYHFHSSGQLPGAYHYLALLLFAEAVDGILKGSVYFGTGKLIDELGTFERFVRLVGGRRNVYVWILTIGLLWGAPAKAFMVMAWLQAATAAVHVPRVAWVLSRRSNLAGQRKMRYECVVLADSPGALVELCGISVLERLLRTLQRCEIARVTVLSSTPELIEEHLTKPSWARAELEVTVRTRSDGLVTVEQIVDLWPRTAQLLLVIRGDTVFDNRLLHLLSSQTRATTLVDSAVPQRLESLVASALQTDRGKLCGAALLQRDWLPGGSSLLDEALGKGLEQNSIAALDVANEPLYHPSLRREFRPFWFPAPADSQKKQAERILLDSVQKGSQDLPAYVHAPIERFLVSHLCQTSIRPNQLTVVWAIAALATTILFATGHLVWGIALALLIGILDGLDGKQARLKVETTTGGKLEHQVDTFLECAWPSALAYHFYVSGQLPQAFIYLGVLLTAEALDGIGKLGVYTAAEKLRREAGVFDRVVRLFGGRRNIYIWVLIACMILGAPATALIVMAWWELATAVVDLPHAAWTLLRYKNRFFAGEPGAAQIARHR